LVYNQEMNLQAIASALADLHLPELRYFDHIDSTNNEARRWVTAGAPHYALVVADEQTAGKGRLGRHWITPPGMSLAFSLVLLSPPLEPHLLTRLAGLGAVAVCAGLQKEYFLRSEVKWPNDVLVGGRKAAGVLAESLWSGDVLQAAILGIGINIAPQSVSAVNLPPDQLAFPVTCIETELGSRVDRLECLHAVLFQLIETFPRLGLPEFIHQWESSLAFRDQWVSLSIGSGEAITGKVAGLEPDGGLKLLLQNGQLLRVEAGEMQLRPSPPQE
jgi:BirA family biotin operon repressor/biotin-[acetyl-CoA-carboxylase] ligase